MQPPPQLFFLISENQVLWSINLDAHNSGPTFRSAWCDRACCWHRRRMIAGFSRRRRNPEPASRPTLRCRSVSPVPSPPSSSRRCKGRRVGACSGEAMAAGSRQRTTAVGPTMTLLQRLDCRRRPWRRQRTSQWTMWSSSPTCELLQHHALTMVIYVNFLLLVHTTHIFLFSVIPVHVYRHHFHGP